MIPFDLVQTALAQWASVGTGIALKGCFWNDLHQKHEEHPQCRMTIRRVVPLGEDERVRDPAEPLESNSAKWLIKGNRHLHIEFRVITRDQSNRGHAFNQLERARSMAYAPSQLAALRAVGLAQVRITDGGNLSRKVDDRIESWAAFEAVFAIRAVLRDDRSVGGVIDSFDFTSHLVGVDGAELPLALQATDVVVNQTAP